MPDINPEYFEALAREQRNRYLAYCDDAPALDLRLRTGHRFPFPSVALRWRHVLDLLRSGNAFLSGEAAMAGDFEEILWALHPYYRTVRGCYANLRAQDPRPLPLYSWLSRRLIRVVARQLSLPASEKIIRLRLRDAQQDRPALGSDGDEEQSLAAPTLNHFDYVAGRLALAGWSRPAVLEENVAYTYQVLRASDLMAGKGDRYVPPSAQLLRFAPSRS